MNRRAYIACITLIGKLAAKTDLMSRGDILTIEEQDLVRQSLEEYRFYNSTAGTEVDGGVRGDGKDSGKSPTRKAVEARPTR